jgi:hypothetical protein
VVRRSWLGLAAEPGRRASGHTLGADGFAAARLLQVCRSFLGRFAMVSPNRDRSAHLVYLHSGALDGAAGPATAAALAAFHGVAGIDPDSDGPAAARGLLGPPAPPASLRACALSLALPVSIFICFFLYVCRPQRKSGRLNWSPKHRGTGRRPAAGDGADPTRAAATHPRCRPPVRLRAAG